MKKKWLLALFLWLGIAVISACAIKSETSKNEKPNTVQVPSKSDDQDQFYAELSSIVDLPKQLKHSELFDKEISFVARAQGEAEQMKSKDETLNGEWYVPVFLMRNQITPIYLNISDVPKESWPKKGEILKIKGTPIGYLYTSYNNERLDLLDVKTNEIKLVNESGKRVLSEKVVETPSYKIELTGTDGLLSSFDSPSLVIYYNFKNKRKYTSISPLKTYFEFSQKEELLETTFVSADNKYLDSKALNTDSLESGEEMFYYEVFELKDTETPVDIRTYDDEYILLNELEISVPKIEGKQ